MIGWIVAGAIIGGILLTAIDIFWNDIAQWLNGTAANAVERALGYDARKCMQKAVAKVTKMRDKLHNKTQVYTRRSMLDVQIQKVTLSSVAPLYTQDEEVIEKFEEETTLMNEFKYMG